MHESMDSLEFENSAVTGSDSRPVPDFYVAKEIGGGVHGSNRSGCNSPLDLLGFQPRGKSSLCQVRVGRQSERHLCRGACWWYKR